MVCVINCRRNVTVCVEWVMGGGAGVRVVGGSGRRGREDQAVSLESAVL